MTDFAVKVTFLGSCGVRHDSLDEWRQCAECARIDSHNRVSGTLGPVPFPTPPRPIFSSYIDALDFISRTDHARAVDICRVGKENRARFFFIGNGGSAAIAGHMAADFLKTYGVAAMTFNEAPLMSALANDLAYDQVFCRPLRLHAREKDILFAISSSGRSHSIIQAMDVASALKMSVITLSGFKPDNRLRQSGIVNFYIPSDRYGIVEVAHHAICHSILDACVEAG